MAVSSFYRAEGTPALSARLTGGVADVQIFRA
jgi:hypothetical protein